MNRLLEIGFEKAGYWVLNEANELSYELTKFSKYKNILYAFICGRDIKYIGKTVRTLDVRMYGYKSPKSTQTTNERNHELIKQLLLKNKEIEIFALPDNGLFHYGQFHINLAAGLEDDLIGKIQPEWNGQRKSSQSTETPKYNLDSKSDEELSNINEYNLIKERKSVVNYERTLENKYYNEGFFNVVRAYENFFGKDGESIKIFLGDKDEPIIGQINRRCNTNYTPRIFGYVPLRKWIQENFVQGETMLVSILSPTEIWLQKMPKQ
ncbi:GIY-YIG nuclease family protein [Neisseria sp. 23W00296]|uniref:GIY-YIG nuclease family protein n=1 Tax=unclassified Neisseria TaxID=2623750 RepID=UPI003757F730